MRSINKNLREALFRAYIERNKTGKDQKRFDVIFGTAFLIWIVMIIIITPVMIAFSKQAPIIVIDVIYAVVAVAFALFRKKRIMKIILPIEIGDEKIEKIDGNDADVLERLYEENAFTMGLEPEPDAEFYNLVYNWLNGLHGLKDGNLKLYLFKGEVLNQKYNCQIRNDANVICISMEDLDINEANGRHFAKEYRMFGRYLREIVAGIKE